MKAFLYRACAIIFSHFVLYPDYRISFFIPLAFRFADYNTFNLKPTRIRVFLSGENLFTIKDKTFDGFDPENGNSVGHYTNWGDDFPTPRILLIGTNLTF